MSFLKRSAITKYNTGIGLLILRVMSGGLMLTHGYGKFMQVMGGDFSFGDPIGIGEAPSLILTVLAEFLCSIFIIFGFLTRLSTIPLIITMLVAALIVHADDPIGNKELALLYLSIFILLFYTGPGKYSVDRKVFGA